MKKTKNSQSSHPLVAFSILIIIASLLTANILLYFQAQKIISLPEPISTESEKTIDNMSDWRTYSNNQYNFSFKYPPTSWEVTNETSNFDYQDPVELFLRIQQSSDSPYGLYIRIQKVTPLADALSTFREEFNYSTDTPSALTIRREWDISGIQAKTYCNTRGLLPRCQTLLLKGDYLYIVGQLEDRDVIVYDQILSTFRFTDDMSGWETYTNTKYNYSFARPADWEINGNCLMGAGREFECSDIFVNDSIKQSTDWSRFQVQVFDDYYRKFIGNDLDAYITEIYKLNKQGGHTLSDIKPMSLNGQTGYSFITHNEFTYGDIGGQTESYPTRHIFIPQNKKLYHVFYDLDNTKFDQILSTFKFIK